MKMPNYKGKMRQKYEKGFKLKEHIPRNQISPIPRLRRNDNVLADMQIGALGVGGYSECDDCITRNLFEDDRDKKLKKYLRKHINLVAVSI